MPIPLSQGAVFISNDDVIGVSSMEHYIRVVENAYARYGLKKTVNLQRQNLWFGDEDKKKKSLKLLAAATPIDDVFGAYVYSGGYSQQRRWQKCFILYSFNSGNLLAVIESDRLSKLKTGAVSAVAAKHLSRKDAHDVGIFGAGKQAVTQLEGICKIRDIKKIRVYSRTESARREFCRQMTHLLGVAVEPSSDPEDLVRKSDIVITATTSKTPVFDGGLIRAGTHVIAIGAHYPEQRELDEATLRGKKVVVDTMDSVDECGEFTLAGIKKDQIHADLGDICSGIKPGRENPSEITVFKSGGRGIDYLALADFVYRQVQKTQQP